MDKEWATGKVPRLTSSKCLINYEPTSGLIVNQASCVEIQGWCSAQTCVCTTEKDQHQSVSEGRNLTTEIFLWVLGDQVKIKVPVPWDYILPWAIGIVLCKSSSYTAGKRVLIFILMCAPCLVMICLENRKYLKQSILLFSRNVRIIVVVWRVYLFFFGQYFVNYKNAFKFSCLKKFGRKIVFFSFLFSL